MNLAAFLIYLLLEDDCDVQALKFTCIRSCRRI
ncbi:hypothetical protein T4C_3325 [Trichinella pseudospiralis]|uniref:Uncharacterized protein n=1 Tax=Trichinella pseudospiralis TaxID=6337 RepID=A0A0V1GPY0_TRIPS|nr:hypothetical protein T4C_1715 [Trichinella pseudospiralis]KRZ00261.1 hypothetical protein T4C_3325 [Trichinella pseudospiralis]